MSIALIIYLVGIIPAYFIIKHSNKKFMGVWTKGQRVLVLFFSLLSWIGIIAALLVNLITKVVEDERPATW